MLDLKKVHCRRNEETVGYRRAFDGHRNQVMGLLRQAVERGRKKRTIGDSATGTSVCVLGAGNGNDLELPELLRCCHALTLVDIDADALDRALTQLDEFPELQRRLMLQKDTDVTGILNLLSKVTLLESVNDQSFDTLVDAAADPPPVGGKFDIVASTCILSQIVDTVAMACGQEHPRLNELVLATRDGHLRLLKESLKPNGTAVLISDFISSDTLPELKNVTRTNFQELILGAINQGNFFTGINPRSLQQRAEEIFGQRAEISNPWTWQLGQRVFACFGIVVSAASAG